MTWKLQAITGEFTGQEITVDRDMLVDVIKMPIYYYRLLKFHDAMQHCC